MPTDTLLALLVFAAVSSITPGPSNFMLLASGANFGFRRTVPQILGIAAGFGSLLLGVGLGLGAVLTAVPALHLTLKLAGAGYLLFLAWRIGSARAIGSGATLPKPLTFAEAAAFQWVNPKAWVAAISAMAVYVSGTAPFVSVILVSAVFALAILPSLAVWTGCGLVIRDLLSDTGRLRLFNLLMGALLAATLWPLLHQGL